MREIIRTLIHEGIETEDIINITRYLLEEYTVNENKNLTNSVIRAGVEKIGSDNYLPLLKKAMDAPSTYEPHQKTKNEIGEKATDRRRIKTSDEDHVEDAKRVRQEHIKQKNELARS